jgi:hypothetical protein
LRRNGDIDAADEIEALLEYIDGLEKLGRLCAKVADDKIHELQRELSSLRSIH